MDQQMFSSQPNPNSKLHNKKKNCAEIPCHWADSSVTRVSLGLSTIGQYNYPCAEIHALFFLVHPLVYLPGTFNFQLAFTNSVVRPETCNSFFSISLRRDADCFYLSGWKIKCQYGRMSRHFSTPIEIGLNLECFSDHLPHASSLFMIYGQSPPLLFEEGTTNMSSDGWDLVLGSAFIFDVVEAWQPPPSSRRLAELPNLSLTYNPTLSLNYPRVGVPINTCWSTISTVQDELESAS
jgi:hypothetical protein